MATAMLRCDVPSEHMSTQCMRVRSVALWCIPHEWRYQTPPSTVHVRPHVLRPTLCGQWGECARGYRQPRRGSVHLRHVCVCVSMRRTAVSQRRCGIRLRHGSVPACAAAPCSSGGVTRPGHESDGSRLCGGVRGVCPTFPIGDADSGWCVRRRPVILLLSHSRIHHPLV